MFHACGLSETGRVRKTNEDYYAIEGGLGLFVLADGMGGHNAGEVASRLAVEAVVGFIQRTQETDDVTWPYGIDTNLSYDGNRMKTAIQLGNRRVFRAAESRDEYTGMGTTVVAALMSPGHIAVGHVGDSRLYVFRDGCLHQVTRDDTWLATVLAEEHSSDAGGNHPMRNVLTNVLGAWEQVEVHVQELPVTGAERVLLCSDGLHAAVPAEKIAAVLAADDTLEAKAGRLIKMAIDEGSRDNISVVLLGAQGGTDE